MGDDIIRLQRVIDASSRYLTSKTVGRNLEVASRRIKSVRRLIEAVIEPHLDKIDRIHEGQDTAIEADPYWLEVCLKNIVENAIHHGHHPICVRSYSKNKWTYIIVENRGHFVENGKSAGLGLGVKITAELIKEMGGRFKLTKAPNISCEVSFSTRPA